jgi:hypothetical protein
MRVRFIHFLESIHLNAEDIAFCIVCIPQSLCVQVTVDIDLPHKGEYGLEIFANDPQKDNDMFTHVSQYLCSYADGDLDEIYGKPTGEPISSKKPLDIKVGSRHDSGSSGPETPGLGQRCLIVQTDSFNSLHDLKNDLSLRCSYRFVLMCHRK